MRLLSKLKMRSDDDLEELKDFLTEKAHMYIANHIPKYALIDDSKIRHRTRSSRKRSEIKKKSKILCETLLIFTKNRSK